MEVGKLPINTIMKNRKIQIIIGLLFIILSIPLYIFIHGTKHLALVSKINNIIPIIPIFPGRRINNLFINGYLIDILWFSSLILFSTLFSSFSEVINSTYALIFAVIIEILQSFFPSLGTFDFYDIICYLGIFFLYNGVKFISEKVKFRTV